ncbi:hypothetical protein PENTCL1PPCAC_17172, partial [Pristionchus entomophagus]
YRYFVLRNKAPSTRVTVISNLILSAPTTICFVSASLDVVGNEYLYPLLSLYLPQYDLSGATYLGELLKQTITP